MIRPITILLAALAVFNVFWGNYLVLSADDGDLGTIIYGSAYVGAGLVGCFISLALSALRLMLAPNCATRCCATSPQAVGKLPVT